MNRQPRISVRAWRSMLNLLLLAAILAGCGSAPRRRPRQRRPTTHSDSRAPRIPVPARPVVAYTPVPVARCRRLSCSAVHKRARRLP